MPYPDPGFYWILIDNQPEPALWNGNGWAIIGVDDDGMPDAKILSGEPLKFYDAPGQ